MQQHPLRVLAVEPDPACREHLRNLLARQAGVNVELVATADAATAAMHANPPDLILTSAVLPPRAEEQMIDALKHLDPDGNVPVITVPPLLEAHGKSDVRSLFSSIGRRKTAGPSYDAAAVVARIDEALRQVREAKHSPRVRAVRVDPSTAMILRPSATMNLARAGTPIVEGTSGPIFLKRKRLERARRVMAADLPSRCTLTTPAGFIVRMLNVSESGVLFESPLKFTRDAETSLSLFSPQASLVLPARIVRSDVAAVNGLGVTYQTAAQFSEALDLVRQVAPPEPVLETSRLPAEIVAAPASLADLLVRITTELYQHQRGEAARAAFQAGLRQLVPACDIRLCDRLVHPTESGDSVYFAVPGTSGVMVQATFDQGHEPTAEDFKLLRAAAAMASVIVHGETHSLLVRRSA
jgi:CheY-like chemotaxis protein